MTDHDPVLMYISEQDAIDVLTPEQREGILDIMVIAILINGEVSDPELDRFEKEIHLLADHLPSEARKHLVEHAREQMGRLEAFIDDGPQMDAFLTQVAEVLPTLEHRKIALRMAIEIAYADGFDWDENALFDRLGRAFELTEDQVDALVAEVIDANRAS